MGVINNAGNREAHNYILDKKIQRGKENLVF
jgi:hypothetical protein